MASVYVDDGITAVCCCERANKGSRAVTTESTTKRGGFAFVVIILTLVFCSDCGCVWMDVDEFTAVPAVWKSPLVV
jgi:hypothetical protein